MVMDPIGPHASSVTTEESLEERGRQEDQGPGAREPGTGGDVTEAGPDRCPRVAAAVGDGLRIQMYHQNPSTMTENRRESH